MARAQRRRVDDLFYLRFLHLLLRAEHRPAVEVPVDEHGCLHRHGRGLVTAAVPMLTNNVGALYLLPADVGRLVFLRRSRALVVGSWIVGQHVLHLLCVAQRESGRAPFIALAATITMAMWQLATLGVAAEILFNCCPMHWHPCWAIRRQASMSLLNRTLFWWFGHPLVYFWLLPAYVSWYAMLPAQTNGKMFSEPLARLVFWLFLLFSTPVGFITSTPTPASPDLEVHPHDLHHGRRLPQRSRPSPWWHRWRSAPAAHAAARATYAGSAASTGVILPCAQNLAMILFIFGGIGGLINASYNVNMAVHNTMWVPGHFHLTVGSASTLTFFGIAYWLVPKLTGRKLFTKWLALAQAWTWFFGMLFFSNARTTRSACSSACRAAPCWVKRPITAPADDGVGAWPYPAEH